MEQVKLTMSVGRDYRLHGRYEFVIFEGDMVIHREGAFTSSGAAKRAGLRAAEKFQPTVCPVCEDAACETKSLRCGRS